MSIPKKNFWFALQISNNIFNIMSLKILTSLSLQAQQREEETQHTLIMLRRCEEKVKQLELLVDDKLSAEKYLIKENKALREEIQLLQASIDKNPESSELALENERLLQQLQQ